MMTDPPNRVSTVESASTESEADPPESTNPESGSNLEWRFDIDFRLNPNWLSNPGAGAARSLPMPLSMLNDWIRNIQRPISSDPQPSTSAASSSAYEAMRNNITTISTESGTRPISSDSDAGSGVNPRVPRPVGISSTTISDVEQGIDYPPPSSRRSSRPIVIDLPETNPDWTPSSPSGEGHDIPQEEPHAEPAERSASDILRQSPEARAFLSVLERYLPFLFILLIKGILDHGSGITVFFGMIVTFSHANTLIRKEVTKQGKRSIPLLLVIIVNILICVFCLYYVFQEEELYPALVFLRTSLVLSSVHTLLWLVLVTDYVAKFITIMIKCFVIMLPEQVVPFKKRGKYYLFVESSSQLYRCLLPIYPWLIYLFTAYEGSFKIFAVLLCLFYIICKAVDVAQRIKEWKSAFIKFLQSVHYGTAPTAEEMSDLFCPICHDGFSSPTKLCCGHIFCEDCVGVWLDRGEKSCPMCRARVVQDTSWRDGRTTHFIQTF